MQAAQHTLKGWTEAIELRLRRHEHEADHRPIRCGNGDQPVALLLRLTIGIRVRRSRLQGDRPALDTGYLEGLGAPQLKRSPAAAFVLTHHCRSHLIKV